MTSRLGSMVPTGRVAAGRSSIDQSAVSAIRLESTIETQITCQWMLKVLAGGMKDVRCRSWSTQGWRGQMRRADRQDEIRRLHLKEEVRRLSPGREEGLTQDVSLLHELKVLVSRARSGRRDGEDFHWKDLQSHRKKRSERALEPNFVRGGSTSPLGSVKDLKSSPPSAVEIRPERSSAPAKSSSGQSTTADDGNDIVSLKTFG